MVVFLERGDTYLALGAAPVPQAIWAKGDSP